ncbi:hypothetical protein N7E02_28115 [Aliirhizobium terrae]|uniref:hypothetical protein n=1 Tax=Terrirhizobium terrae TaxID=2926709 RepID=UPI002574F5AF|nr:hypothetical protein [Rhizobium sp. CC-CFT758]WJH40374.1 hypothetical protein N7E02_28115 [Rhizobium sp. CC-CFT758]
MKKYKPLTINTGRLFAIELADELGFGFGYATLSHLNFGHLVNIFKAIGDTRDLPPELFGQDLIITDHLINDGPFVKSRNNPVPWVLLDSACPNPQVPRNTFFRVGNRIFDMQTDQEVTDDTLDPDSFPPVKFPMDDRLTYEVTALLTGKQWRLNEEKDLYEIF